MLSTLFLIAALVVGGQVLDKFETPAQRDARIAKEKPAATPLKSAEEAKKRSNPEEPLGETSSTTKPWVRLQADPLYLVGGVLAGKVSAEFPISDKFTFGPEAFYFNSHNSSEEYRYVGLKAKSYVHGAWNRGNSIYLYESTRWTSLKIGAQEIDGIRDPGGTGEWLVQAVGIGWMYKFTSGTTAHIGVGYEMPLSSNFGYRPPDPNDDADLEDYYNKGLDLELGIGWTF